MAERYAAFISYRHVPRDRNWALKLIHGLETFRVPATLRRQGHPARLGRMFRDEDELPTSADLNDQIRAALAASDNLIVVCSPETPQSRWVRREIETFKEMGKGDRILTLLVAGEPDESFPPELRHRGDDGEEIEPLGADVRPSENYSARALERRAILKFAAGILHVGFDDLVQRDAQRRRRRVQAIAAGVGAVVAFGAAGGWFYWDSQLAIKTEYCRAVAEHFGEPSCVASLTATEAAHRERSWRLSRRAGVALELALVNGRGRVVSDTLLDATPLADWAPSTARQTYQSFATGHGQIQQFDQYGTPTLNVSYTFSDDRTRAIIQSSAALGQGHRRASDTEIDLFPFDLRGAPATQIGQLEAFFDANGQIVRRIFHPLGSLRPAHDQSGSTGELLAYSDAGLLTEIANLGASGDVHNNRTGVARQRFVYDGGEVARIAWSNLAGNPWPNGDGFVAVDYRRDERGNLLQAVATNRDGAQILDPEGIRPGFVRRLDGDGRLTALEYRDGDDRPLLPEWETWPAVMAITEGEDGLVSARAYLDADGNPTVGPEPDVGNSFSYARKQIDRDERGRIVRISYWRGDGQPGTEGGWSDIGGYAYEYDAQGRVISSTTFGPDGNPLPWRAYDSPEGAQLPTRRYEYDAAGNLVMRRNFDEKGEPARDSENFASYRWEYDDGGNPLVEARFDEAGKPADPRPSGVARIEATYDEFGNRTSHELLNAEGSLSFIQWLGNAKVVTRYDGQSNPVRVEEYWGGAPEDAYITETAFDDVGRPLRVSYLDAEGKLRPQTDNIARIEYGYDDDGNLASEAFYGPDGRPTDGAENVSRHTMVYDNRGHMVSDEAYDVDGNLLTDVSDLVDSFFPEYDY